MAGIDLTGDRRSQLLEMLLAQQVQPRQQPIRSGGELAARLAAQLVRQQGIKKLQGEETAAQQQLADALVAGQPTGRTTPTLEGIPGAFGREQLSIPGKKAVPSERRDAINNLPFEDRMRALQAIGLEKELAEPGFKDRVDIQSKARINELEVAQKAVDDRLTRQLEASARESQFSRDATAEQNAFQRNLIRTEGEANRASREHISEVKQANDLVIAEMQKDAEGLGLSAAEQKAMGWYTSFKAGMEIITQELEQGYNPSVNDVANYAKSVDRDTSAWMRVQWRRLIDDRALNFLDGANMIVDPIVRMRTGAQVNADEFIKTFNDAVPIGDNKTQIENKNFFRQQMEDTIGDMSGAGKGVVDARFAANPAPRTIEGSLVQQPEAVDPNKPLSAAEQEELRRLEELEKAAAGRRENEEALR
jgi:hypothetical protein